jgi:hypothetical protein
MLMGIVQNATLKSPHFFFRRNSIQGLPAFEYIISMTCFESIYELVYFTNSDSKGTYSKTCLKQNLKGPEHFSAEAKFPLNQGIL